MNLLVLYRIEAYEQGKWCTYDDWNGFEAPILAEGKETLLLDLIHYIVNNSQLSKALGINYLFFAEKEGCSISLSSLVTPLPVQPNNTIRLRLQPSASPLCTSVPDVTAQHYVLSSSNKVAAEKVSKSSSSSKRREGPQGEAGTAGNYNTDQTLNNLVGEDTAAVLNDAAEVAKEAARSLFAFAANVGKSVIDVASNVSAGTNYPGKLSLIHTIGNTKVQIMRQLSEAGFGVVYLVQDVSSGRNCAMKQMLCQNKEQITEAHGEIDALRRLKGHQNIIELLDHNSVEIGNNIRQVLLLFPLYTCGTAWEAIERATGGAIWPFPEVRAIKVTLCTARALLAMHNQGMTHRDVKPHNILLDEYDDDSHVLMDFGSVAAARVEIRNRSDALAAEDEASRRTSMAYRPPELTQAPFPPCTIDERVDVWGLGCTMFCLAFGRSPFETAKEGVQRLAILNGRYNAPADRRNLDCVYSEEFSSLVAAMLQVDIKQRKTMSEVIRGLEKLL
jgi:serine/threonine kinase 16